MLSETLTLYSDLTEKKLAELLSISDGAPILQESMAYSVFSGGKRIRPALCMAACEICGGIAEDALLAACAVELIHTYSLIHDDLPAMDNDDLRRGRPTCHKAYGEGMAVLAGDGLLSLAFETMAQSRHPRAFAALGELAARCGTRGMLAGQCADLTAEETGGNAELLRYIHLHKTADLLTAPLAMGLTLAGAGEDLLAQAREYGKNLGIAFQIIDDILDVTGDEATLGKHTGKDAQEHKCTWVSLYGLDQARKDAKTYTERAADSIKNDENAAIFLKTLAQRALVRVQ